MDPKTKDEIRECLVEIGNLFQNLQQEFETLAFLFEPEDEDIIDYESIDM